jgi:drug/metabolite transporter (DMT)-like permease
MTVEKIGLVLLSGFLFSITIASIGIATRYVPPATVTTLRVMAASAVLWGMTYLFKPKPEYHWHLRGAADMMMIGLLNIGLPFLCLALAVQYISGALAAVLFNTIPVFTLIIAHYLLPDEKLNFVKIAGTMSAVAGATLLILSNASGLSTESNRGWIGQFLILVASLISALGVIYTRLRLRNENTLVLSAGQALASLIILVPIALLNEGWPALARYPGQAWAALIVAALTGPVLSMWLLLYMTNKYSASLAGFSGIATPLFSVIIGSLFLGEVLTPPILVGALLVLIGVWSLHYF